MGKRNINTISNVLSTNFNFTNKMGISLRIRHYLSTIKHLGFYFLNTDGRLSSTSEFTDDADNRVNFFNVDLVYTWQFASGSFFNVVWKDASCTTNDKNDTRYFNNLNGILDAEQNNNFSIKVIYFIDYQQVRKKEKTLS